VRLGVGILSPHGYLPSETFREVAEGVHCGFLELGHDSRLDSIRSGLDFEIDRRYVIFGANILSASFPIQIPHNCIIFNLEQIGSDAFYLNEEFRKIYAGHEVWDYNARNIFALAELGITAKHVPLGYVPEFSRIGGTVEHDIDVLFYGAMNERRVRILAALESRGLRVSRLCGVYGAARDAAIARAKIVLNVHFYPTKILEEVRLIYLLANGRCVVSEDGDWEAEEIYKGGVAFCEYDQLVDRCVTLLNDVETRWNLAARGLEIVTARPQAKFLESVFVNESPVLTVGLLSIPSRVETFLPRIVKQLDDQARGKPVEILAFLDNKQSTVGEKRNQIAALAKGRFLTFVDDDDLVTDDYVETLLAEIGKAPDTDCFVFNAWITEGGKDGKLTKFGVEYAHELRDDVYYRLPTHVCCHRTENVRKVSFQSVNLGEDVEWANAVRPLIHKQVRIEKILYHYQFDWATTETRGLRSASLRRLNVGCGNQRLDGWIGIDRVQTRATDIVRDVLRGLPFEDSSVDEILCDNFLEHIGPSEDLIFVLNEFYRVLKPEGIATIIVPDGRSQAAWQDPTHVRAFVPRSSLYWSQDLQWAKLYGITANFDVNVIEYGDRNAEAFLKFVCVARSKGVVNS